MKIFTIFFLVLSSVGLTFSQSAQFEKNETTKYFQLEVDMVEFQDIETHVLIENTTFDNLEFTWVRDEQILPTGWETAICDNVRCWLPNKSTSDISMALQDTFSFIFHLYPNDMPGDSAVLTLAVNNLDDPEDKTEVKVTFINGEISSTSDPRFTVSNIKIAPNPARNVVRVEDDLDRVRYVEVYSITGKQAAQYELGQDATFLINELPSGTYVLRMMDESRNVLVSRRLQKI